MVELVIPEIGGCLIAGLRKMAREALRGSEAGLGCLFCSRDAWLQRGRERECGD